MANFHETNAVSGPLNSGLLNKDELLKIVAHQRVGEILPGDWESSKPGSGYEFDGLRAFQPGDLASRIDWSALGRTGKLYVREFFQWQQLRSNQTDKSQSYEYNDRRDRAT